MATPTRPAAGPSSAANATPGSRRLAASAASRGAAAAARPAAPAGPPVAKQAATPAAPEKAAAAPVLDAADDSMPTPANLAPVGADKAAAAADKPAARPSARLAAQAPAAGGARRPGSTARHEKAATGRHDKPATARHGKPGTGRYQQKSGGYGRYVVFGLIALVVIGALSYGPVTRSMAMGKLDAAKGDEAILAADAYMKLVEGNPSYLRMLVKENHGPVEAQVHVAKEAKEFSSLVVICERPLSDPPPAADGKPAAAASDASLKVVTQDQRILALDAATAIYVPETMTKELLPDDLAKWAKDGGYKTELSLAAMRLIAKARPKYAMDTLLSIATAAGQDAQRTEAAIDAIAATTEADNLGYSINLLGSRVSDLAVSRTKLTDNIIKLSSPDHLASLVALLSSPKDEVRAIAIEAMGGPHMQLGDSPADYHKREELGKNITPKLDEKTPPVELAATLKAVKGLRLIGARDAVLALVPKLKTLHLEGISAGFMSDLLGKALISTLQPADAGKDAKGGAEAAAEAVKLATEARTQSEDLITKLIAALDDDASRAIAAGALMEISDPSFLSLRAGLDKLQAHGENPDCFTALTVLVDKTYNRSDVVKANGKDLEKWKDFLASDRPHFDRVKEILDWMATHKNNLQIGDGRHKAELGEAKDYIAKAQEELDAWLMDPKFVSPLGLTKSQISSLVKDLKMKGKDVRSAFAGSTE
jgi:hypothetical protein